MNLGQMAMVIGAMMLVGIVKNNFQRAVLQDQDVLGTNRESQNAIAIARGLFDEIQRKAFDLACTNQRVVKLNDLSTCGPASYESYPNFNDIDDFEGSVFESPRPGVTVANWNVYPRALRNTEGFKAAVRVQYVNPDNPEQVVSGPTWSKRVTITVTNSFSKDTLVQRYVAAY
jgi:hypothetical protein